MAWRAARSLLVLREQLQAGAPRARPPATGADEWGLIGDTVHDPTSDHTPHDFPGLGQQVVTAADFPNRPDLGLDAHAVLDDIRRSHDQRVKYGISNGQMFSSYDAHGIAAWTWRPYTGSSDKHYTHGHLSVVGDARADGTQPWPTIGRNTGMEQSDQVQGNKARTTVGNTLADLGNERDWWYLLPDQPGGNPPPAGSRADLLFKAVQKILAPAPAVPATLTDADQVAIADRVAGQLGAIVFRPDTPVRP